VVERFLDPTFADSRFVHVETSTGHEVLALVASALLSLAGIALAYQLYVRNPGVTLRLVDRFPRLHGFLAHKWYFDEAYDRVVVRPMTQLGEAASATFERVVIDGVSLGTAMVVRAGNSLVRVAQSGLLRYYALALMTGVTALALYFLIAAK